MVEQNDGLLIYPLHFEGEENSKNVVYMNSPPSSSVLPAVDYLMGADGGNARRFFMLGSDYVWPRTINKILKSYWASKGIAPSAWREEYVPFGFSNFQNLVNQIRSFTSAGGEQPIVVLTVFGNSIPDFLLFLGEQAFPAWWAFADSPLLTILAVLVVPASVAFAFGYVSFRSRVNGVYFSIITQALTYTAMLLMFRNSTGFGGNNGMTGFHDIAGLPAGGPASVVLLATLATGVVLLALLAGRALLTTRFGRLLTAIRDDEPRLRFLGYDTLWLRLAAWCLSASLAAVAGALYVPQIGIINPGLLDPALSLEVAVWVAIGGRGGLVGAILGAVLINLLKFWLAGAAPALWPFVLSVLVLGVVLVLPNGLLDIRNRSRVWLIDMTVFRLPGQVRR